MKQCRYSDPVAAQKELRLIPRFSLTQVKYTKSLKLSQRNKSAPTLTFEGQVKSSKVKSHMNWWVKCISAVIAKTASRNVAFKARRLRESIMEGQDSFIMREPEDVEAEFGEDSEDVVADAGNNADLYAANQGSTDTELVNEAHTEHGGGPVTFHGSRRMYFIISRLVLTKCS